MPDGEKSGEILGPDATLLGATIKMMRGVVASGEISADQLAILKANLPKLLDHLKDASKSDAQAMKDYLDFLSKIREINISFMTQRSDLIKDLLGNEEDPEHRKRLYERLEELFEEEKADREHARSEGVRTEKESRGFRKDAVLKAIMVFTAVVMVGVGTTTVLMLKEA